MANKFHVFMIMLLLLHALQSVLANKFSSLSHHADECSLLLQFKESMSLFIYNYSSSDPRAHKFTSWSLNGSDGVRNCCLWDGVECRFGHVIGLDLSNSFLYGPISSNNSLFNLIHLRTLNLAVNDFCSSRIPSSIGRLSQLAKLNLSYSVFGGEVPKQISQLGNLVSLDLTGNHQLTLHTYDIRNLVQNSSETLRELLLSDVDIGSKVPASIGNLTRLNILKLGGCGFTGTLPASISILAQLTVLDLSTNEFTGSLPSSIGNLTQLTHLDLSYNKFIGILPSSVGNLTQVRHLHLTQNKFTGSLPSLESFSNLTYLSLFSNNFDRWKLPDWLGKLKKITFLALIDVNLYGEIPSSFFNLTQVKFLYLAGNQLKGELPSSLMLNLQNLEYFRLDDGNNVTMDFYPFLSLKQLQYLDLRGNNVTLSIIESHTNETQPNFRGLDLASCNLKVFPKFLRFQHQLKYLYLDNNNIEGLIPGWMWNISKETLTVLSLPQNFLTGFEQHSPVAPWVGLETLDLSHNMLHGSIPVPPPTTLHLLVSYNKLTGEIPPSLCHLQRLELLDLSFNNISGSIPSCLKKLNNSLKVLNLRSNTLQGTTSNIFSNECKLEMIDLSENKFEGRVPRSLINCESLQFLDLGHNFIKDKFPYWLGALSELQVLILKFNRFHGIIRIPSKIKVNFPKLCIIDLSYNSFSGDLPHQYFQAWSAMKETEANATYMQFSTRIIHKPGERFFSIQITSKGIKMEYVEILNTFIVVDLSSNMFTGKIPDSIKTLTGLNSLNLSNNELSGIIPPSMGNLMRLESLDLSSNKLSGMIPKELVQLNFLEVLNLSSNSLTGPIPQGKQFSTFSNNSYMGNPALCGYPLSMKCGDPKESTSPKVSLEEDTESDFPNRIDWVVILIGAVSGLLIGLVWGVHLITRCYKGFLCRIVK